jgi:DNA-binding NtrC family response regulator
METQAFERLGGTETMQVDIRFIGATNRPLEEMIAAGSFREDFYFRLNVLPVALPPLREHKEDIPHLARHFAERIGRRSGKPIERIARGAIRRLVDSDWPGNVRQLQNAIERAVALYAHDRELDEAAVVQALGLEVETRGNPGLNMRQRELIELLGASEVGLTVGEIQRQLGARQPGGGRSGRTLQNDLRKLAALGYADWVKDGSAHRYSLRDSA